MVRWIDFRQFRFLQYHTVIHVEVTGVYPSLVNELLTHFVGCQYQLPARKIAFDDTLFFFAHRRIQQLTLYQAKIS